MRCDAVRWGAVLGITQTAKKLRFDNYLNLGGAIWKKINRCDWNRCGWCGAMRFFPVLNIPSHNIGSIMFTLQLLFIDYAKIHLVTLILLVVTFMSNNVYIVALIFLIACNTTSMSPWLSCIIMIRIITWFKQKPP